MTELRLPKHGRGKGLGAVMVRPNDATPPPLALLMHGTPRGPERTRYDITPLCFIPQAREFASRGWTAVVAMRRGYEQRTRLRAQRRLQGRNQATT